MTIDIKCPHCKKDTDYNLNYKEDFCDKCNKEINYVEMYSGSPDNKFKVYVETDLDYNEYEFDTLEEADDYYNSIDETSGIILPDGTLI